MSRTNDEYLSIGEVADLIRVPVSTVRQWRYQGTGPRSVRLGRHVRYRRADVEAWIDERYRAEARP